MKPIPVAGPWITQKEVDFVSEAVRSGWYERSGEYPARFEKAFAQYIGVRHAVSLPSCTSGLHLALAGYGIGPGDEVIVPDITWIATSAPISYVGAQPVFADVDERSWCISPESFRSLITPRTKAVIPVDLYGHVYASTEIRKTAREHGIRVIEDAAEAIGSRSGEQMAGSMGDAGVFSFHGSKTLTTGEGGMLVTDDSVLYDRILYLRDHGRIPGDKKFWNGEVAYKYRMSSLQAALGLAQLERIEELIAKKREIFGWYREALGSVEGLCLNAEDAGTFNTYWMVSVTLDESYDLTTAELMQSLAEKQVDTRSFFHPLSSLPAYQGDTEAAKARSRNRVAYRVSRCGLNLPSALCLTREDVAFVCARLKETLQRPCRVR